MCVCVCVFLMYGHCNTSLYGFVSVQLQNNIYIIQPVVWHATPSGKSTPAQAVSCYECLCLTIFMLMLKNVCVSMIYDRSRPGLRPCALKCDTE